MINKNILTLSVASIALLTANVALAATAGPDTINFNATVQDTISMTCHETGQADSDQTIDFGTITAGTPVFGSSDCDVTTNDENGYYLSMRNGNGSGETLTNDNGLADIHDTLEPFDWGNADPGTGEVTTLVDWGTNTGLGFTVATAPTKESEFGSSTTCTSATDHKFGGAPSSTEPIMRHQSYSSTETTTSVCYIVDVTATQPSGTYSGSVVFTATSDASSLEPIDQVQS